MLKPRSPEDSPPKPRSPDEPPPPLFKPRSPDEPPPPFKEAPAEMFDIEFDFDEPIKLKKDSTPQERFEHLRENKDTNK